MNSEKAYQILKVFIPLAGILVGFMKIFGAGIEVNLFREFGVSDSFRMVFGATQAIGASMMFFSRLVLTGIFICVLTLVLATCMMMFFGVWHLVPVPVFGMVLLGYYARLEFENRKEMTQVNIPLK